MEKRSDKYKTNKLKTFLIILIIFFLMLLCMFLWSRFISTSGIKVNEFKIVDNKLPASYKGLKIVHISDIHYSTTINKNSLKKIVNQVNLINPDLVLFTGDLIDKDVKITDKIIKDITSILSNINSKYGKYAIRGDHDYESDSFIEIMQESDFKILENSYDLIYNENNDVIYLGGLTSSIESDIDYDNTLSYFNNENSNKNIFSIVMMHEPDNIEKLLNKKSINLVLAGHSHGGQIRLPILGGIMRVDGADKYNESYYKISGTNFYISYGVGTTKYPFRFLNKPSMNFYRLFNK